MRKKTHREEGGDNLPGSMLRARQAGKLLGILRQSKVFPRAENQDSTLQEAVKYEKGKSKNKERLIKMRNYRKIEISSFWVPEQKGDVIEGEVINSGISYTSQFGQSVYMLLKQPSGELTKIGYSAGLENALEQVNEGNFIRITYQGEKFNPKTKRRFKSYEVEVAE